MRRFTPLLSLLVLGACLEPEHTATDSLSLDGSYDTISIDLDAGDVEIRVADVEQVQIERIARYRDEVPEPTAEIANDALRIRLRCTRCSVDHRILIPQSAPLEVVSGAGELDLRGFTDRIDALTQAGTVSVEEADGDLLLESEAGDIVVSDSRGDLDAYTQAGDVLVESHRGTDVRASSQAGDVRVLLDQEPDRADVSSQAGRVTLEVPASTYAVEATSSAGRVTVDNLTDDWSAERLLRAHSDAGDVTVRGR